MNEHDAYDSVPFQSEGRRTVFLPHKYWRINSTQDGRKSLWTCQVLMEDTQFIQIRDAALDLYNIPLSSITASKQITETQYLDMCRKKAGQK